MARCPSNFKCPPRSQARGPRIAIAYDDPVPIDQPILSLDEIRARVFKIVAEQMGIPLADIHPTSRLIQDLHMDSLDNVELVLELETEFGLSISDEQAELMPGRAFTTREMNLEEVVELIRALQGAKPAQNRREWFRNIATAPRPPTEAAAFTQLDGKYVSQAGDPWLDRLEVRNAIATTIRRRTDGMVCVRIPADEVEFIRDGLRIGKSMEAFFIDMEPVSTSAYCRFLNTIGPVAERLLAEWFICAPGDRRDRHQLIRYDGFKWKPLLGVERWPMILVSWYGANAYALWASGRDWYGYRDAGADGSGSGLPSEDQFEYAARGPTIQRFPWGDEAATLESAWFGRHERGTEYPTPQSMPIVPVNRPLGISPFGPRHMAGNVWQWCGNELSPGIRAERGGSWIGPAFLCECSYRRGRVPDARGRCLGFRLAIPT